MKVCCSGFFACINWTISRISSSSHPPKASRVLRALRRPPRCSTHHTGTTGLGAQPPRVVEARSLRVSTRSIVVGGVLQSQRAKSLEGGLTDGTIFEVTFGAKMAFAGVDVQS